MLLDLAPLRTGAPPAARTLGVRGCAKHQTPQRRTRRERVRHRCAPAHRCAPGREDAGGKRARRARPNTPGRTRTCDPLLRRQMLYPAELRGLSS